MASAVLDQNIGDAIIEQTGRGALVQHLTHYFTADPIWRTILVCDLDHGQLEYPVEILSYRAAFVSQMNGCTINEPSVHLLKLMYVRDKDCLRIVTGQSIGTVDHEEYAATFAGGMNGIFRSLDQMIESFGKNP